MAAILNTFLSTDATANREELSDVVNRISPEDTPIYTMAGGGSCDSTYPEWTIDTLATPAANAQEEGDEYAFDTVDPVVRVGNPTQIMRKTFIVSNTQEKVDNAGDAEKTKYQKLKHGVELRKDVEFAIVDDAPSVQSGTRNLGSLETWLETNTDRGVGGADGGFSQGTGLTVASTAGTQRAFSKAQLDDTMQSCYVEGANVKYAVMSPYAKSVFVTFMSDTNVAQFRYAADSSQNTIVANADMYDGPFGKVAVVPNRVMAVGATQARNVFLIDPEYISFKWLRPMKEDKGVAKTGDAKKCVLIGEGTLKVNNEAAHGVIADIYGLTASS